MNSDVEVAPGVFISELLPGEQPRPWRRRRPLLTRAQLERLNGGPLPLLTAGPWRPPGCFAGAIYYQPGTEPTLFLPVSDRERQRWEFEERLRRHRLALLEGAF